MKKLELDDVIDLANGAAFLGSGGGGNPHYEVDIVKNQIKQYGPTNLIKVTDLENDDLLLPVACVGAPLVLKEKIPSGKELPAILKAFRHYYKKSPAAIMPAEIGGANGLTPFMLSSRGKINVVDGDLLGRAYPELQMASANLYGVSPGPAFIGDAKGNCVIIEAKDAKDLENIARSVSIACGSMVMIGVYVMTSSQARTAVVRDTISQAVSLGKIINNSRNAIDDLQKATDCELICSGVIIDIDYNIVGGFLKGTVTIKSNNELYVISYQNEYLAIYKDDKLLCCTPDIISILEQTSSMPITSDNLIYGLRVNLVKMKANDIWYSQEGLKLVGPEKFKINTKEI